MSIAVFFCIYHEMINHESNMWLIDQLSNIANSSISTIPKRSRNCGLCLARVYPLCDFSLDKNDSKQPQNEEIKLVKKFIRRELVRICLIMDHFCSFWCSFVYIPQYSTEPFM